MLWLSLFHFLGSVRCSIALILFTAAVAALGTFLETASSSHLLACLWAYENPVFISLLFLFFINILFAALRRWPFKKKHIPFLSAHLGLLMVIAGLFIKNQWGVQGTLLLWEGERSGEWTAPHSYALFIQAKEGKKPQTDMIFLSSFAKKTYVSQAFPSLEITLHGYAPHAQELWHTWIKEEKVSIAGFPPLAAHPWQKGEPLPQVSSVSYALSSPYPRWSLLALQSSDVKEALAQTYFRHCQTPFHLKTPSIVLIEEKKGSIFFALFDLLDGLHLQPFDRFNLKKLHAFDEGFGGYIAESEFSLPSNFPLEERKFTFQTPLSFSISPLDPPEKREERTPAIALKIKEKEKEEEIALLYDVENKGLKWPILDGRYQIKFEPHRQPLPFFISLKQARALTYPDSSQIYSYEADLTVEPGEGLTTHHTLSMNRPLEIAPGYRFFLSGIASLHEGAKKQARLTVTYDPAKYILTYPGACLLVIGAFLLFFAKNGERKR